MKTATIWIALAFVVFCCITYSYSIKCYICSDKRSCFLARKFECNEAFANATRLYVEAHHLGSNRTAWSTDFDCFKNNISSAAGNFYYRGCIYRNTEACSLPLRPIHTARYHEQTCTQCNKNGCNSAGHLETASTIIAVAAVLTYIFSS